MFNAFTRRRWDFGPRNLIFPRRRGGASRTEGRPPSPDFGSSFFFNGRPTARPLPVDRFPRESVSAMVRGLRFTGGLVAVWMVAVRRVSFWVNHLETLIWCRVVMGRVLLWMGLMRGIPFVGRFATSRNRRAPVKSAPVSLFLRQPTEVPRARSGPGWNRRCAFLTVTPRRLA